MRSLETAAQAGVVIVVALAGIIATEAAQYGFPAIRNGELPLWGIKVPATYPFLNISFPALVFLFSSVLPIDMYCCPMSGRTQEQRLVL